jgi:hypothetical protein
MLLSPFRRRFNVEGDTPRLSAIFLALIAEGVIYISRKNSPGCGGLCMAISDNPHNSIWRSG